MSEEKELVVLNEDALDSIEEIGSEIGLDVEKEVANQTEGVLAEPFLKVEHDGKEGKHGFYIKLQESIVPGSSIIRLGTRDEPVDCISLHVLLHRRTRSYFADPGQNMPSCAAVDGIVSSIIEESYNDKKRTCEGCPLNRFGTDCQPRVRMLIAMKYKFPDQDEKNFIFNFWIPPTSLSSWKKLIKKCNATKTKSGKPLLIQYFMLKLQLRDDTKGGNRFARVDFDIERGLTKEEGAFAKEMITKFEEHFSKMTEEVHAEDSENQSTVEQDVKF